MAWEELSSSEGRCTAPGRELFPFPGEEGEQLLE